MNWFMEPGPIISGVVGGIASFVIFRYVVRPLIIRLIDRRLQMATKRAAVANIAYYRRNGKERYKEQG